MTNSTSSSFTSSSYRSSLRCKSSQRNKSPPRNKRRSISVETRSSIMSDSKSYTSSEASHASRHSNKRQHKMGNDNKSRSTYSSSSSRTSSSVTRDSSSPDDRDGGFRSGRRHGYKKFDGRNTREVSPPIKKRIVVTGITNNVNRAHIKEIFGNFGKIADVYIPTSNTGFSLDGHPSNKSICYIEYSYGEGAEKAITAMNGGTIDGSNVTIEHANDFHKFPPRRYSPEQRNDRSSVHTDSRYRSSYDRGERYSRDAYSKNSNIRNFSRNYHGIDRDTGRYTGKSYYNKSHDYQSYDTPKSYERHRSRQ